MTSQRNQGKSSWHFRRRVVVATLLYCAAMVAYITFKNSETRLAEAVATSLILLAGSVIGSYVFGAVWDDKIKTKTVGDKDDKNNS